MIAFRFVVVVACSVALVYTWRLFMEHAWPNRRNDSAGVVMGLLVIGIVVLIILTALEPGMMSKLWRHAD